MKTKYPVIYEGYPTPPQTGDMLVWDGTEWVLLVAAYGVLSAPSGSPSATTWDCKTGLNKKISIAASFTLKITNVVDGLSGDLVLNQTSTSKPFPSITLQATVAGDLLPISTVIGNGILAELNTGVYHICWVYDGTRLTYNIARYADTI